MKRYNFALGIALISFVFFGAVLSFFWLPYDPNYNDWANRFKGSSRLHWLDTDNLGRDLLSQLLVGARGTLYIGFVAVSIALSIGCFIGAISAFIGGLLDEILMRLIDILLAFPALLMALLLAAIYEPSRFTAISAIGIATIPTFARLMRVSVLKIKEEVFVESARALGVSKLRILGKHILPNTFSPIIVQVSFSLATAVLAEAALSFLGLGAPPLIPSWGNMLLEAQAYRTQSLYGTLAPGIAIVITVLGWSLLGDGLRDRFTR